ncbi:MAG: hypothetical protein GWN67_22150 [Phycisphaerae bacterium]|nr:hypothetical protein [Phycisphaerae bacterium]NIP54781.1 hypothetical protein [Phycisphaerae bacterium]NIS50493.1 hypothetical protein [Phycisphaerae bacterium]NIU11098.1 hypothetical protein [Phycisphaerae bacterium]NIU58984.1 hypothetical protein [Phycisphaerae bacterium]
MKKSWLSGNVLGAAAVALVLFVLGLGCAQRSEQVFSAEQVRARNTSADSRRIDPVLLEKVRPLYPNIRLKREGSAAFFSIVREVFRVRIDDATERLIVEMRVTVPAALVDHAWGAFLLFKDAGDTAPIAKVPTFVAGRDIRLVENRWVSFRDGPLVSLLEDESLKDFSRAGGRLLDGLARGAAKEALMVYLNDGLDAFLKLAPIRAGKKRAVGSLPQRVGRVEIYPSLVEDYRTSGFRYSSPWEGTILVRVTSADPTQESVILDMGAKGWAEGITVEDVELIIQERRKEPTDRPGPEELLLPAAN